MKIRINEEKIIRNADVLMSSDGRVMTVKAVNPEGGVAGVAALLEGEPKIEVMESVGTEVKAVYQGAKATAVSMELNGGIPIVTVTLLVSRASGGDTEELRRQIDAQATSIAALRQTIENQTFIITAQEAAIKAIEEGIADA